MRLDIRPDAFSQIVTRMVIERNVRPFAGKNLANSGSDATRPARNKRTLSFK